MLSLTLNARCVSTALFLAISAASLTGAAIYVNPSGNDANPGTQSAPFRTVRRGAQAARAGDTVILADGTYGNEGYLSDGTGCWYGCKSPVTITSAGNASAWITIKAEHKGSAILDCQTAASLGCDMYIYLGVGAAYWSFEDLVVRRGAFGGITTNNGASHIRIKGCRIEYIGNFYTTSQIGITAIGFDQTATDWRIEGNTIHDIGRTGGLSVLNHDHGIYASGSYANIVNNVFYNNTKGWSIQTSHGTDNWLIADNTFAFPSPSQSGHIMIWDGGAANSLWNITIRNNIFYSPANVAIVTYSGSGTTSIPGCSIDNNLTNVGSIYSNGMSCSVSNNRTGTDPKLVNVSVAPYDFHLQAGSPAIDAAVAISLITADLDGILRPQGLFPDRGAYEYVTTTQSSGPPPPPPPPPSGSGPVARWEFNEQTGTTTADLSGNGNTGTLRSATWTLSGCTACLWLSGSRSYVSVGEAPSLQMTSNLTVSMWIKPTGVPTMDPRLITKLYDWEVKLNSANLNPQFSSAGKYAIANYAMRLNAWQHVAFTFSNGLLIAYVNGVPVSLSANTFAGTTTTFPLYQYGLYIGTDPSIVNSFQGYIDDVRLYNRPLSTTEVGTLYTSTFHY